MQIAPVKAFGKIRSGTEIHPSKKTRAALALVLVQRTALLPGLYDLTREILVFDVSIGYIEQEWRTCSR
jgi:hypothetical protein